MSNRWTPLPLDDKHDRVRELHRLLRAGEHSDVIAQTTGFGMSRVDLERRYLSDRELETISDETKEAIVKRCMDRQTRFAAVANEFGLLPRTVQIIYREARQ